MGAAATDILFLVERLEGLITTGKKLPLTNAVVLDQSALLDVVDQLRVAVPEEVREARRVTEEAARITERAREEAAAIVDRGREQAAFLIEERELARGAEQRAREMLETAAREVAEVRHGADEYAAGVLIRLEGECIKALTSIKRGIAMLEARRETEDAERNGEREARGVEEEQAPVPVRP